MTKKLEEGEAIFRAPDRMGVCTVDIESKPELKLAICFDTDGEIENFAITIAKARRLIRELTTLCCNLEN